MEEFKVQSSAPLRDLSDLRDGQDRIAELAQKALFANKSEGDFEGADGLLYCGVCHKPKSRKVFKKDGSTCLIGADCDCMAKKKREEEEKMLYDAIQASQSKFKANFMGEDVLCGCVFENWKPETNLPQYREADLVLRSRLVAYVNKFEDIKKMHKGLYLFGGLGVGKTFAAACIANALSKKRYRCIVTNFNRIMNSVWTREHRQDILDELNSYDLLVIDDLGTEFDSKFTQSLVYEIIDNRYRMGLPLVVTSNISFESLRNTKSEFLRRTSSRLLEMCHPVEVLGEDRRADKAKKSKKEFNDFLDN